MIIVRAPMRISFVGGGTDLPAFYTKSPGRVISAAINKYSYAILNPQPLSHQVAARYSRSEWVNHAKELQNDRIREGLLHMGITNHVDVTTFSDVPVKTGLGSSSSFVVALMKALYVSQDKEISAEALGELASHLEIELIKEPIGKQDQYAATFGGINIFQFNQDHSVAVAPVPLTASVQADFENHIQVFYTGIDRDASSVLHEQSRNVEAKFAVMQKMADSVFEFRDRLLAGDFPGLGAMLHDGWMMKKTLASNVSLPEIDDMYAAGMGAGAWGGKVLGAGGGGCLLFLTPLEKKPAVKTALAAIAEKYNLKDFVEIPVNLAKAGVEVLLNHENGSSSGTTLA